MQTIRTQITFPSDIHRILLNMTHSYRVEGKKNIKITNKFFIISHISTKPTFISSKHTVVYPDRYQDGQEQNEISKDQFPITRNGIRK